MDTITVTNNTDNGTTVEFDTLDEAMGSIIHTLAMCFDEFDFLPDLVLNVPGLELRTRIGSRNVVRAYVARKGSASPLTGWSGISADSRRGTRHSFRRDGECTAVKAY